MSAATILSLLFGTRNPPDNHQSTAMKAQIPLAEATGRTIESIESTRDEAVIRFTDGSFVHLIAEQHGSTFDAHLVNRTWQDSGLVK